MVLDFVSELGKKAVEALAWAFEFLGQFEWYVSLIIVVLAICVGYIAFVGFKKFVDWLFSKAHGR
jgi:hypothetical protein